MNAPRFLALAVLLAGLQACADQSAPFPPGGSGGRDGAGGFDGGGGAGGAGGGSGGSGGAGGTGGMGGMGGEAGASGTGGAGGGASLGACNNPDDLAALTTLATNPRQLSAQCALTECLEAFINGEADFLVCVDDCIERGISGLSPECAHCYGALEWCNGNAETVPLCWTKCSSSPCDSSQDGCLSCSLECLIKLDDCTGRMSTDCDV